MKLSELPFGAPFVFNKVVYYKMYPTVDCANEFGFHCYPVKQGYLQTPMVFFYDDIKVEPYVHTSV